MSESIHSSNFSHTKLSCYTVYNLMTESHLIPGAVHCLIYIKTIKFDDVMEMEEMMTIGDIAHEWSQIQTMNPCKISGLIHL